MKYTFIIDKRNNQRPQNYTPTKAGNGTIVYNKHFDKLDLTKEQALEVLPKLYPGHEANYIYELSDSGEPANEIPEIEEWRKPGAPSMFTQHISFSRLARVVNFQVKGNETWLWLRIERQPDIDKLIYLKADDELVLTVAEMQALARYLPVDVTNYTERGEHSALKYLADKNAPLIQLISLLILKRDDDGTITKKLGKVQ